MTRPRVSARAVPFIRLSSVAEQRAVGGARALRAFARWCKKLPLNAWMEPEDYLTEALTRAKRLEAKARKLREASARRIPLI